jgi:hypothetical protein
MQPQDVAELLRATVSDADAVAQYLLSIDAEEVRASSFLRTCARVCANRQQTAVLTTDGGVDV